MKKQQGMATLLITSVLLLVALLFSLASHKNLFYQIKRSQNEVLARQAHWQAEGGVECLWSVINDKHDFIEVNEDIFMSICDYNNNKVIIKNVDDKEIVSFFGNKVVRKRFDLSQSPQSSLITSTADLIINGDIDAYPQPGEKTATGYNCKIAEFSGNFEIKGTIKNKGFHPKSPPYKDFIIEEPNPKPSDWNENSANKYVQKCSDIKSNDFFSESIHNKNYNDSLVDGVSDVFDDDYQKINSLDPFKNIFGYPRDEWKKAKIELNFLDVDGGINCAKNIKEKIASLEDKEKKLLWITGDCDLSNDIFYITDTQLKESFILVVQDGLIGFHGSASILDSLIYQLKTPDGTWKPTESSWKEMNATVYHSIPFKEESNADRNYDEYIHYQAGSLIITGGIIFDAPGYKAEIIGSGDFSYNGDIIKDNLSGIPKWKKGSWRDF